MLWLNRSGRHGVFPAVSWRRGGTRWCHLIAACVMQTKIWENLPSGLLKLLKNFFKFSFNSDVYGAFGVLESLCVCLGAGVIPLEAPRDAFQ